MMINDDNLIFSTGKSIYTNSSIVGICLSDDDIDCLYYGSDGGISLPSDTCFGESRRLNSAECVELADAMLSKWQEFREKYSKQ